LIFEVMDDLVSGWEARLRELTGRMGHLFARPEPREVFHDLVEGLLSDLEKKNGWTGAAGRAYPSGPDADVPVPSASAVCDGPLLSCGALGPTDDGEGKVSLGLSLNCKPIAADRFI
jgi:hypothetical protein